MIGGIDRQAVWDSYREEPIAKSQKPLLDLSSIRISQQLSQAGFVLVFFGVLLVLCALHRRWRP